MEGEGRYNHRWREREEAAGATYPLAFHYSSPLIDDDDGGREDCTVRHGTTRQRPGTMA